MENLQLAVIIIGLVIIIGITAANLKMTTRIENSLSPKTITSGFDNGGLFGLCNPLTDGLCQ